MDDLKKQAQDMREWSDKYLEEPARYQVHQYLNDMLDAAAHNEYAIEAAASGLLAMWHMLAGDAHAGCRQRHIIIPPPHRKASLDEVIAILDELHEKHPDKNITALRVMAADKHGYGEDSSRENKVKIIAKMTDWYNPIKK